MIRGKRRHCVDRGMSPEWRRRQLYSLNDLFGACLEDDNYLLPVAAPHRFIVCLKAQAHRLRLGGLTLRPRKRLNIPG
jgi:hypothetical protein